MPGLGGAEGPPESWIESFGRPDPVCGLHFTHPSLKQISFFRKFFITFVINSLIKYLEHLSEGLLYQKFLTNENFWSSEKNGPWNWCKNREASILGHNQMLQWCVDLQQRRAVSVSQATAMQWSIHHLSQSCNPAGFLTHYDGRNLPKSHQKSRTCHFSHYKLML